MKPFKNGQTSVILRVKLLDSSSTTGAGLTGLTFSSSGLIIATIADNEAATTRYAAVDSTTETITTLGTYAAPTATKCRFKEVDSTNHKGIYEIQFADARFAVSNAKSLLVSILGASNLAQADFEIPLTVDDPYVDALTVAKTESYRTNGTTGSITQMVYEILANITEANNSGTTRTVKKIDHSTTAMTYTYDNSTPNTITRTT